MNALLKWVREQLGLDGHPTEYAGLHPRQQEALARANSTLEGLFSNLDDIQTLGLADQWRVRKYVQASWTVGDAGVTGEQVRRDLGLEEPTTVVWLFGSTVRWETTANAVLVTVPSSSSARCAIVLAVLPKQDEATGWLDWHAGRAVVVAIEDDRDAADARIEAVKQARRTIETTLADLKMIRAEAWQIVSRDRLDGPADF